ncbi:MAG TPA: phosphatase PAP2 family protein [Flavobacteriales bacterium]|nr:phosphatase PAP2 family protein [Flavobacteriales bacterium]HIN39201.1 phosphatase PAP2 family protein [Flavobacteriales bacterium]
MNDILVSFDTWLFLLLNSLHLEALDPIMVIISGKFTWIPLYVILLLLVIKKHQIKSMLIVVPFIVLLITSSDQISVHLFKNLFERLRPCHNPDLDDFIHLLGNCGGKYGFLSSHASNTFALATFLILLMKQRAYLYALIFWAGLVSYSRIYLGVHYPADILAGACLGILIGMLFWNLFIKTNGKLHLLKSDD